MKPGSELTRPIAGEGTDGRRADARAPYEPPTIVSITEEEILEIIGPAQAYNGPLSGTPGGGSL